MKEILFRFKDKHVRIVKDDNFVIDGIIREIFDEGIIFFTDESETYISFDRIKEIRPYKGDSRRGRHG